MVEKDPRETCWKETQTHEKLLLEYQTKMPVQYVLVVFLLCSFATLDENGMQQWVDFPSKQLPTSSKGIDFEITIQTLHYACKTLHNKLDNGKPSRFPIGRTDLDIQLKSRTDTANITWKVQYEKRCQKRKYMLDDEYRKEHSRTTASYCCVQYNLPKGESKRKVTLTFRFNCIRNVAEIEDHLMITAVWSLSPNWSASTRTLRSEKSYSCRILCSSFLRTFTDINGDMERRQMCQWWRKSNISLVLITDTSGIHWMHRGCEWHGSRLSAECELDPQYQYGPFIMRPTNIFATPITEFIPFIVIMIVSAGLMAVVTIVFCLKGIRKLSLQLKIETDRMQNALKTPPYDANHVEYSEVAVQTDLDLTVSVTRNDDDLAIETPRSDVSSIVMEIGTVQNLHQQISVVGKDEPDWEPSLFQTTLHGTELGMKTNPIFITFAMKMVIKTLLKGSGKVGVRGDACCGKTSVINGAMQIFKKKKKDWNIIRITNEEHIHACYKKQNVLLVIDDILDQNAYMLKHLDTLKYYIDKGYWKVIFSYSNESYKTIESKGIKYNDINGGHVINISVRYECTTDEKIGILNSNCMHIGYALPEETSKQCVELVPTKYFFYCVRSYFNTEKNMGECAPIDFFQNPIKEMVLDLESLKASNPLGFYILFCCSVLDYDLDISILQHNKFKEHDLEISKWLLASNNPDKKCSLGRMHDAVRTIPTDFVEHIENYKYRTKFGCVVRGVHLAILKELNRTPLYDAGKLFRHAVLLCDFSIIRTSLRSDEEVESPLQLQIHEDNFRHVAERFIKEIQSGHVQRVGQHPLFSNDEFKRTFGSELRNKHDEKYIWDIFSKLDKQTHKALIVFAVEHDKPDHATNLTNIILKSKKWRKYSRKEGTNVERQYLVLRQNSLALTSAVRYKNCRSTCTLTALIDSIFCNVPSIGKWKPCCKEAALRIVIKAHAKIVSESPKSTTKVMDLFRNITIRSHLGEYKQSLLHFCVICRNDYLLEQVLKYSKVGINQTDCLGRTPLHAAVQNNNLDAVRILIKYGAVIEIRDQDGNTAIHIAVYNNTHILEELIRVNGTDVNVRNNDRKTPYQLARELNKPEHMNILEKADVNDQ